MRQRSQKASAAAAAAAAAASCRQRRGLLLCVLLAGRSFFWWAAVGVLNCLLTLQECSWQQMQQHSQKTSWHAAGVLMPKHCCCC
jgi:hypothetical protein